MKTADIRNRFLEFFEARGHLRLPSASVIPERDPTLYFVNAGMVPFKEVFTGKMERQAPRATTVQKCLRVSGKHNDLENVGRTPRHHTFFEMLGNFSFGDYFKEDAIPMAWDLLTLPEDKGGFALDPGRLWVTIFTDDDEAAEIWTKKVGFPAERLQRLGVKDNFWSMGDTGPCGPCSEIHYDHGAHLDPRGGGPATESDRYVEIWNNVFMQFDQAADGSRALLPRPSIDTGMGLERLAAIKQGVYWNYDTDGFRDIIGTAERVSGKRYGAGGEDDVAMRVIADHARATAFLVADGIMPANGDREYVLRRIMRRAIRFGVKLGIEGPFLYQAADTVIRTMAEAYPELQERRSFILEVTRGEEERFAQTLERGLGLLGRELDKLDEGGALPGDVVFKLFDTYGFPSDLTELIASERNIGVDQDGYEAAMQLQKDRSREGQTGFGDEAGISEIQSDLASQLSATDFIGHGRDQAQARIVAIVQGGSKVPSLGGGSAELVLDSTPFYAESGGQVGDHGFITTEGGSFRVDDVKKAPGGLFLHRGELLEGRLAQGEPVQASVDSARRDRTRLNHSATHLMHAVLKEVLGEHVQQKGSLVDDQRLRFDFSHHKAVSPEELTRIEDLVYERVLANESIDTQVMDIEAAKESGAVALFGEKYGDEVRVVRMAGFSVELCGGTHASRTGDIGLFRITSESGVAAGVRRIEAVTGSGALQLVRGRDQAGAAAANKLRASLEDLPEAIDRVLADRRRLEKELDGLRRELARASAGDLIDQAREIGGIQILAAQIPGDAGVLRDEADRLRDQLGSALVVLGSADGDKVLLIAAATKDVAGKRLHAGKIVGRVAKLVGGGGGGRPDMAQAGGRDGAALPAALEQVYSFVEADLGL